MTNFLLGIFWGLCYLSIVLCIFVFRKEKFIFMPLISGGLNLAWEILAVRTSRGYWIHIVWIVLDLIIFAYNLYCLKNTKSRLIYGSGVFLSIVLLYLFFRSVLTAACSFHPS